jgi:myo-inositol-1(or 4)-monophosphatase
MERELEVARAATRAAAEAVRAIWASDDAWVVDKAGDKGPLTKADLEAQRILLEHLRAAFPDDAILSEESTDDLRRLGRSRVWILDPVDGTREFVDRVPEFVVSCGLVVDGAPRVGVLVNPATGAVMDGGPGLGVRLDGVPVRVTSTASLESARIVVSRSETRKGWFGAFADRVRLEPVGSVAWKLGLVATGQADATFTPKPRSEWDVAAGAALVAGAGGRTSGRGGQPWVFNRPEPLVPGVVATNGTLHDAILDLMAQTADPGADRGGPGSSSPSP